ncbi:Nif3-like dinuclear metal center hexameric protein [Plebeiibacterium sediminum]|uniref:GTP cyclohydrolase 1 type 2 homolog n=1 Tax=Plebeiibacterium sediminum TaxID=2992112 RepID=A0AAE3M7C0_9BACT|nr:Nif3-like dinuclear metal center hexameric protein [Plebeiobacterium sediminum]MCW3788262.1 Nif3-like dinuclear metal center hexameric protein [Plebeiobacterium sediminum]
MQIKQITQILEEFAPPALQESYDNAGLIIGNNNDEVSGVLITLDVTEEVIDEAIELGYNMIVSHHPVVMGGIKRFNGNNYVERCVIKAIQNKIAIYSSHTNADSVINGVNGKICEKLGLTNCKILDPKNGNLLKLVTFVPDDHAEVVRNAIFNAGAGHIGNYDSCSFNATGEGTFRANEGANPFVGEVGELHIEKEIRVETIFPSYLKGKVVNALIQSHPYEEVAYDIYPLSNQWLEAGSGMYGELESPEDEMSFLKRVKEIFGCGSLKFTNILNKPIKKVAVCGGSGSFLLGKAKAVGADIFITGDFKYHQFFDAENEIIIADIGHFESEQFTKEVFFEILTKKIPNFAVRLSKVNTNPIKYL